MILDAPPRANSGNAKKTIKAISYYNVVSGFISLIFLVTQFSFEHIFIYTFGILLCTFQCVSGIAYLLGKEIAQYFMTLSNLIQILSFSINGFTFSYCTFPILVYLKLSQEFSLFRFRIEWLSFSLRYSSFSEINMVIIHLLPLVITSILFGSIIKLSLKSKQ